MGVGVGVGFGVRFGIRVGCGVEVRVRVREGAPRYRVQLRAAEALGDRTAPRLQRCSEDAAGMQ